MRYTRNLLAGLLLVSAVPQASAIIVASGDPNSSFWSGSSLTGVVYFVGGNGFCSGSLFEPTLSYVLVAAHCVAGAQGTGNFGSIGWANSGGDTRTVQSYTIDPNYSAVNFSNDIAILKLSSPAPANLAYYPIYTGASEIGQNFILAGYGNSGTGATGDTGAYPYYDEILREGQNTFDSTGVSVGLGQTTDLFYDFDSGIQQNNTFNYFFPLTASNTGVRDANGNLVEATIAPGDSGGPSLLNVNGQLEIAGIHSITECFVAVNSSSACLTPPAVSSTLNDGFGDFAGDTRVSLYSTFIDTTVAANAPEPATYGLAGMALIVLGMWQRRRPRL